jgi:hypothetical protein
MLDIIKAYNHTNISVGTESLSRNPRQRKYPRSIVRVNS